MLIGAYGFADFGNPEVAQAGEGYGRPRAGNIDVACNGLQDGHGTVALEAVDVLVDGCGTGDQCRRLVIGKETGDFSDIFSRNPGYLLHLFRRVLLDMLGELLEAYRFLFDEILIIKVFAYDNIHHSKHQGGIRARTNADMDASLRHRCALRVDDNQVLQSARVEGFVNLGGEWSCGVIHIASPYECATRFPGFFDVLRAEGKLPGHNPGTEAVAFHGKQVGSAVNALNPRGKTSQLDFFRAYRAAIDSQCPGAVFLFYLLELIGDDIQGFIPANLLPFPVDVPHRVEHEV